MNLCFATAFSMAERPLTALLLAAQRDGRLDPLAEEAEVSGEVELDAVDLAVADVRRLDLGAVGAVLYVALA